MVRGSPFKGAACDFNTRVCLVLSYESQLLPLESKHFMLERVALHTVLRAPWNTFRHSDMFLLQLIGGPKLRSPNIACASALFRTAAKTIGCWPAWVLQIIVFKATIGHIFLFGSGPWTNLDVIAYMDRINNTADPGV